MKNSNEIARAEVSIKTAIESGWANLEIPSRLKMLLKLSTVEGLKSIYRDRSSKIDLADQFNMKEYEIEKIVRMAIESR